MYVGHYAASFIAKGLEPRTPLALLFVAAQFLDFVFFPLVLINGEALIIVENATASTHFELPYMPFSHSIWATFLWCCLVFISCEKGLKLSKSISLLISLVVGAHWVLDLLVHTPDLAVWNIFNEDSIKWGFGFWNYRYFSFALEIGILVAAILYYVQRTHASTPAGKYIIFCYAFFLAGIQALVTFGGIVAPSESAFAWQALISFIVFSLLANNVDRCRKGNQTAN